MKWDRIKDLLPGKPGAVGVTAKDNQPVFEGCVILIPIAK
ncbi:hypothetical protein HE1_00743 [Holospora elegans E1]|uniref:Uncharacterized protein n=1 Tax=Holospora elegans E1 TaxID=1427503 RepID=A0A023DZG2_9PROT|nr:hypothetical protein HE1_00743 [Holospora elegans E1]